jgi:predicted amidohydrolase YtcJ
MDFHAPAEEYGAATAEQTPPTKKMLAAGVPVGIGTDAMRVALHWLVTGETVGGPVSTSTRVRSRTYRPLR